MCKYFCLYTETFNIGSSDGFLIFIQVFLSQNAALGHIKVKRKYNIVLSVLLRYSGLIAGGYRGFVHCIINIRKRTLYTNFSTVVDRSWQCSSVLYCVHKAIYDPYKLHKYAALIRWLQCDAVKRIAGCNTVHAAVIVLL